MPCTSTIALTRCSAIAGIVSIACYLLAAFLSLPTQLSFLLAMLFPMLGIVALYGIRHYIKTIQHSHANDLALIFGVAAFVICAIFLSAQIAVQELVNENNIAADPGLLSIIRRCVRSIDMGIDVAWDMFIGTYLLLLGAALRSIKKLTGWGITAALLGVALMILNVYTFPVPPADKGLLDLGPLIAIFLIALYLRFFFISLQKT